MSGKNDTCGSDDALSDDIAPMRKWEGPPGTGSYTEGPTHLDRADYGEEKAETVKAETPDDAKADKDDAKADDEDA